MSQASESRDDPKARLMDIHQRLCSEYGCPVAFFHHLDPLSELISSLLSHRTRNHDSGRAFKALRQRFPSWEEVRDAELPAVQEAISASTWPEQKAPRIQAILRAISAERGELSLDFLGQWPVKEARAWLEQLPGVGPKTSAATLLFSLLRRPAMPVDAHHHRVAVRLGLIGPKTSEAASHRLLEAMLPEGFDATLAYDHHEVMMFHGQRCCFFHTPACERCVLLDRCPTGLSRVDQLTKAFALA